MDHEDEEIDLFLGDEDEEKETDDDLDVPEGFHEVDAFEAEPEEGI